MATLESTPTQFSETIPSARLSNPLAPVTLPVAGHQLTVFAESPPLIDAMVRDISLATRRVWVETYIFFNDAGGQRIADALKQKAAEGLDIRLMVDAVGSASTPWSFFADLEKSGVHLHVYHTLLESLSRWKPLTFLNRRNHRKLMVIDDVVGFFGGMNLIDNSTHNTPNHTPNDSPILPKPGSTPISSGWRDIHLRIQGPQVAELAASFDRSWRIARREFTPKESPGIGRAKLHQISNGSDSEAIRFFDSGRIRGGERFSRAARVYSRLIRSAQFQITLSQAYFIPVGSVLRSLLAARRRRVGIRVIVPGKSDVLLVQRAAEYLYDRLIRRGIRIYERQHRMLHSKVMIVDDRYAIVGSANLDPRSLYTNLEFLSVIRSPALARVLQKICRFEISQSTRITTNTCRTRPRWRRLINRLAWSLRWWL